jgi:hypothetical protein
VITQEHIQSVSQKIGLNYVNPQGDLVSINPAIIFDYLNGNEDSIIPENKDILSQVMLNAPQIFALPGIEHDSFEDKEEITLDPDDHTKNIVTIIQVPIKVIIPQDPKQILSDLIVKIFIH